MRKIDKVVDIDIQSMGIVFHSQQVLSEYSTGYNFLEKEFWSPSDVVKHVKNGDVTGLCVGSPGVYHLFFHNGNPQKEELDAFESIATIGIRVDNRKLYIRDLYELDEWTQDCEESICIEFENGIYRMTAGIERISDDEFFDCGQDIHIYFEKVDQMPDLKWDGVPMLLYDEED